MTDSKTVEAVARAIATANADFPDEIMRGGEVRWKLDRHAARAVLLAIKDNVTTEMIFAGDMIVDSHGYLNCGNAFKAMIDAALKTEEKT